MRKINKVLAHTCDKNKWGTNLRVLAASYFELVQSHYEQSLVIKKPFFPKLKFQSVHVLQSLGKAHSCVMQTDVLVSIECRTAIIYNCTLQYSKILRYLYTFKIVLFEWSTCLYFVTKFMGSILNIKIRSCIIANETTINQRPDDV